jgi:hypothetical protein
LEAYLKGEKSTFPLCDEEFDAVCAILVLMLDSSSNNDHVAMTTVPCSDLKEIEKEFSKTKNREISVKPFRGKCGKGVIAITGKKNTQRIEIDDDLLPLVLTCLSINGMGEREDVNDKAKVRNHAEQVLLKYLRGQIGANSKITTGLFSSLWKDPEEFDDLPVTFMDYNNEDYIDEEDSDVSTEEIHRDRDLLWS